MWPPGLEILLPVLLLSHCSRSCSSCISFHFIPSQVFYPSHWPCCCCPCHLFVSYSLSDTLNCIGAGRMQGHTHCKEVEFWDWRWKNYPSCKDLVETNSDLWEQSSLLVSEEFSIWLCTSMSLTLHLSLLLLCICSSQHLIVCKYSVPVGKRTGLWLFCMTMQCIMVSCVHRSAFN